MLPASGIGGEETLQGPRGGKERQTGASVGQSSENACASGGKNIYGAVVSKEGLLVQQHWHRLGTC